MNRKIRSALALAAVLLATGTPALAQTGAIEKIKSFLGGLPGELPGNVWAVAPQEETQDVLFLGESRPVVLRLHVQVDGKGFRTAWDDFARKLYAYLDRDGNGVLTKDEAERGSILQLIQNGFNGGFDENARLNIDTAPADGKISMAELTKFLKAKFGAFTLAFVPPTDARAESMFKRIDRDGDGKLDDAELAVAATSLLSADDDDDEIIVVGELTPYQNPYYGRRVAVTSQGNRDPNEGSPFVAPAPEDAPDVFARQLLKRYDNGGPRKDARARDGKLGRGEIALEPAAFARADADADGLLDATELARLRKALPPDLEVAAHFDSKNRVTFEAVDDRGRPPAPGGGFQVERDGVRIVVRASANGNDLKQYYESQFKAADGDNNKYLEKKETDGNFLFGQLFKVLDRDDDGKLFLEEVVAFAERQQDASRSRTTVTATDQGRALFETVDANRDGRLSARELRRAAEALAPTDRDGDGRIALAEVPRHYLVVIGRGATGYPFGNEVFEVPATPRNKPAANAPAWFTKMDRNGDGDVSRREFLGPRADFDRLDRDGDGLLDAVEAGN